MATWDDLRLPDDVLRQLHEVVGKAERRRVAASTRDAGHDERIGASAANAGTERRERGMAVVFAGAGPVAPRASEVVARSLGRDLYRVDLSAVVSRYIGETERNLRRLFDAVEVRGAILFFDEADSLFGKRTSVGDGHDRYANQGIEWLLRSIEPPTAIAILASNLKETVDPPWWQRVDAVVRFTSPAS
jgi:hypothetical protein